MTNRFIKIPLKNASAPQKEAYLFLCDNNIFVGNSSKSNVAAQSSQIVIGNGAVGNGSYTTVIGNTQTYQQQNYDFQPREFL